MAVKNIEKSDEKGFAVNPIGYVRSGYHAYDEVPHRHGEKGWTKETSKILLLPRHGRKLSGLEGYSHIIVLFWNHRAKEWRMPKHHGKPPHVKVFATRMPVRPNPISLSAVKLIKFSLETGELEVKGLDALDGTPIIDIKPYIADFDSYPMASIPEWVRKHLREHHHEE